MEIYGGFSGTETLLNQRDPASNVTTLSGDIGVLANVTDNSYHVVTSSGTNNSAILDGFTITGGNANGSSSDNTGGGILNDGGSPTLSNLIISGNRASANGGGMYNNSSNPILTYVIFDTNTANRGGGASTANSSHLSLTIVIFDGNSVPYGGGLTKHLWLQFYPDKRNIQREYFQHQWRCHPNCQC